MQVYNYHEDLVPGLYLFESTPETPPQFRECRCSLVELIYREGRPHIRRRGQLTAYLLQGLDGHFHKVPGIDSEGKQTNVSVQTTDTRPDLLELYEAAAKQTQTAVVNNRLQLIEDRRSLQQPPSADWLQPLGFVPYHGHFPELGIVLNTPAGLTLTYFPKNTRFQLGGSFLRTEIYNTRRAVLRLLRGLGVDFYLRGDLPL